MGVNDTELVSAGEAVGARVERETVSPPPLGAGVGTTEKIRRVEDKVVGTDVGTRGPVPLLGGGVGLALGTRVHILLRDADGGGVGLNIFENVALAVGNGLW